MSSPGLRPENLPRAAHKSAGKVWWRERVYAQKLGPTLWWHRPSVDTLASLWPCRHCHLQLSSP